MPGNCSKNYGKTRRFEAVIARKKENASQGDDFENR